MEDYGHPESSPEVSTAVEALFSRSRSFATLPPETRRQIVHDAVQIADYLVERPDREVDFPDFVAGVIEGVFGATVDASIQQMEAYASLLHCLSQSLDAFLDTNVSDQIQAVRRRLATDRQQLLATMVLMGINRVAVSSKT
jgi:hypothetical protein